MEEGLTTQEGGVIQVQELFLQKRLGFGTDNVFPNYITERDTRRSRDRVSSSSSSSTSSSLSSTLDTLSSTLTMSIVTYKIQLLYPPT